MPFQQRLSDEGRHALSPFARLGKEGTSELYEEHADSARVRKYYRLTQKGKKFFTGKTDEWKEYSSAVSKFWKEVFAVNVSDAFHRYAEKVCEQTSAGKGRILPLHRKLRGSSDRPENAYLAAGDSESIAEEKALLQMGDPVSVGAALDQA